MVKIRPNVFFETSAELRGNIAVDLSPLSYLRNCRNYLIHTYDKHSAGLEVGYTARAEQTENWLLFILKSILLTNYI